MDMNPQNLDRHIDRLTQTLLDRRTAGGYWQGRLSSSALSTATALFALSLLNADKYVCYINSGIDWLAANQNPDGGFGDTAGSPSNLPTTLLALAAMTRTDQPDRHLETIDRTKTWINNNVNASSTADLPGPREIVNALNDLYGKDRTFSIPILTMCALAGLLGPDDTAWKHIKPLPFELAALSPKLFSSLRLSVVSYAIPALIAIGQAIFHFHKPLNPIARAARHLTRSKTLKLLASIQPANGGFLEAVPLTSFVMMSLIAAGNENSDVVDKCASFLTGLARGDGSWAIDSNLATWVTTLSVNAIANSPKQVLSDSEKSSIKKWLLDQQHTERHPYTNAAPGGWAWTDLPGGVPDADDTPGAIIALRNLGDIDERTRSAAGTGLGWIMGLQNKDGGIATFCRGWNKLPFDRSSPDLTAHCITAASVWLNDLRSPSREELTRFVDDAVSFLVNSQQSSGAWIPLWFGNQSAENHANPVYGTSRVLIGLSSLKTPPKSAINKAVQYLLSVQNADAGFGGDCNCPSSIEETALVIEALTCVLDSGDLDRDRIEKTIASATDWLCEKLSLSDDIPAAPIGLYFAKLWYSEELYPITFTLSALNKLENHLAK